MLVGLFDAGYTLSPWFVTGYTRQRGARQRLPGMQPGPAKSIRKCIHSLRQSAPARSENGNPLHPARAA